MSLQGLDSQGRQEDFCLWLTDLPRTKQSSCATTKLMSIFLTSPTRKTAKKSIRENNPLIHQCITSTPKQMSENRNYVKGLNTLRGRDRNSVDGFRPLDLSPRGRRMQSENIKGKPETTLESLFHVFL